MLEKGFQPALGAIQCKPVRPMMHGCDDLLDESRLDQSSFVFLLTPQFLAATISFSLVSTVIRLP